VSSDDTSFFEISILPPKIPKIASKNPRVSAAISFFCSEVYNIPRNKRQTQLSTLLCLCKMLRDNPCPEPDLQMALKKKKKKKFPIPTDCNQSLPHHHQGKKKLNIVKKKN